MKAKQIVLIGMHGAGKTTIGRLLAADLGISFDCEIGKSLRRQVQRNDSGSHALCCDDRFDERVMLYELVRDFSSTRPRVIETWHPGNLAFAMERSPNVCNRYFSLLSDRLHDLRETTIVQSLVINAETALQRQSEHGDDAARLCEFFARVAQRTVSLVETFSLPMLPSLSTDDFPPEACAAEISRRIREFNQQAA